VEAPRERLPEPGATAAWRRHLSRGRGRRLGILVSILLTLILLLPDPGALPVLRLWALDAYQSYFPRPRSDDQVQQGPVIIVEIDDDSLRRKGQWPWPRDLIAQLLQTIAAQRPGAIAMDILFTEQDRTSPERVAEALRSRDPAVAAQLSRLKSNDAILAEAIAQTRAVLGVHGVDHAVPESRGRERAVYAEQPGGTPGMPPLHNYAGGLRSLPILDRAAVGHGLLTATAERGIVRRMPLVAAVDGEPILGLSLEAFRVINRLKRFEIDWAGKSVLAVRIGEGEIPTHPDGTVWIYFTRSLKARYVSAADVLDRKPEALSKLQNRPLVLIGATALALLDSYSTALGTRMPGVEIHAQLFENALENALLTRPTWMRFVEAGAFLLAAMLFIVLVPRTRPREGFIALFAFGAAMVAAGIGSFVFTGTLLDLSMPLISAAVVFGLMLSASLVAANLERRELSARLAHEREAAARVAGELEAARRIQSGILPTREAALRNERRMEIFAYMKAAREVGGDLYDFFPLSEDRFVVLVGDVSDKGLPAAMFMAVSKALAKSCALRTEASAATLMTMFNSEISRENPEQMFVTLVLIIIDLRTGELRYCNAGHEPPLLVRRSGEALTLDDGGGPPLCVVDDFQYEDAGAALQPRDVLTIVSDGITEAMNRDKALYGRARLKALLESPGNRDVDVTIVGNEVLAAVKSFEAGAEPSDDQTLLLVSWRGPQ
jgi:serine phosphatase RsbU (regulator of sigma subunit)/CHASE2 domain-containing sensor protein